MNKYYKGFKPLLLLLGTLSLLPGCSSLGIDTSEPDPALQQGAPEVHVAVVIPDDAKLQFAEALSAIQSGDSSSAELLFQQMTVQYPTLSGPFLNLGIIYLNNQDYDRAIGMLEQSRDINPENPQTHNLLGAIAREQGRFEDAEAAYLKSIAVDADYADAHFNLGIVYDLYMGRLDDAVAQYEIYRSLMPEGDEKVTHWVDDLQRRIKQKSQ